jgi:hypothetical protein
MSEVTNFENYIRASIIYTLYCQDMEAMMERECAWKGRYKEYIQSFGEESS